jgi:hypothetical protein
MRHLWSLIAGVVLAPIVWAAAAYGQAVTAQVSANGAPTSFESKMLIAAAAFVGAGLVFGIIGTLRLSPVGPLVAGLAYLACYGFAIAAPGTAKDAFDRVTKVGDYQIHYASALTTGLIPVLGAAALMAVFSAGRWRTWPTGAEAGTPVSTDTSSIPADESSTQSTPAGTWATPSEESSSSPWSTR